MRGLSFGQFRWIVVVCSWARGAIKINPTNRGLWTARGGEVTNKSLCTVILMRRSIRTSDKLNCHYRKHDCGADKIYWNLRWRTKERSPMNWTVIQTGRRDRYLAISAVLSSISVRSDRLPPRVLVAREKNLSRIITRHLGSRRKSSGSS